MDSRAAATNGDICDPAVDVTELEKVAVTDAVPMRVRWRNVILFTMLHAGALVGLYQLFFTAYWSTLYWSESE